MVAEQADGDCQGLRKNAADRGPTASEREHSWLVNDRRRVE
jgi:hypothetical protein